jgi:hypothetical protein
VTAVSMYSTFIPIGINMPSEKSMSTGIFSISALQHIQAFKVDDS